MSTFGPKRTCLVEIDLVRKSAFAVAMGGKADMTLCSAYVGF